MKRRRILFIMIFLCLSKNTFSLSFFSKILDGDRKISSDEQQLVDVIVDEYQEKLEKLKFNDIEESFYKNKVMISIEYNDTFSKFNPEKKYMGKINNRASFENIYLNFIKFAGEVETVNIESIFFSKQPYDYPVGNIFYLVLEKKYTNLITKEVIFISKDKRKICEHIIYIPKD